ncbi:universal stress protein [Haloplanus rubicundus]|uniref:Universal stress protein n=1 Tax=Haloplanus rubicundus TaxID=1547898 RepID=A0A345EFG0_9EURY|nr:universal stress protein [Haloplanus rubicundus]AXG07516.1 universal stress protein [Haloplanus rubicundus]AXG10932.1 universal stress protein [Haloplanus rubicundus]
MYSDILVPTDGSDASAVALDHALSLAARYDARVHGLYVVDWEPYGLVEEGKSIVVDRLHDEGAAAVASVEEAAESAGVNVRTSVVEGDVHRRIIDYAGDEGIDLIVMGTHGRRGLDRLILGSVTERVVRSSPVPVLTVRQRPTDGDETRP